MKVFFVVDTDDSALHTSAKQWCKRINGVTLITSDFFSFNRLIEFLLANRPDVVFFSWRQVLDAAFLSKQNLAKLEKLTSQTIVLALIADHTAQDDERMRKDERLSRARIGLVPVSKRLFDSYSRSGLNPIGVLPDMPDVDLIREVRSENIPKDKNSVIWVGNSSWGKRQGFVDHKGLVTKYQPFLYLAGLAGLDLKSETVDSALTRIPQRQVLRKLAEAELLVVTSKAEGTGLPILEALGVGTNVLSSDVGISNLLDAVSIVPIDATPRDYLLSYEKWKENRFSTEECIMAFENYLEDVNRQWDNLVGKIKFPQVLSGGNRELLEDGYHRLVKLLLWNLKFFLRWVQKHYAK